MFHRDVVEGDSKEHRLVNTDLIEVGEHLLPPDPKVVDELADSIKKIGLLNPILLRQEKSKDRRGSVRCWLVAGRNRLEAHKKLKIKAIEAIVETSESENVQRWQELAEIDENLVRRNLTPAQRALLLGQRKKVYEGLHPETKHGGDRRSKGLRTGGGSRPQSEVLKNEPSFVQDTARKTGRSKAQVERDVRPAKLGEKTLRLVAGTSLDSQVELDALARREKEEREELAERAAKGEQVSAREPPPEPKPGYSKLLKEWKLSKQRMNSAWKAASNAARKQFIEDEGLDEGTFKQLVIKG